MAVAEPWVDRLLEEYFMQVRASRCHQTPCGGPVLERGMGVPGGRADGSRRSPAPREPHGRCTSERKDGHSLQSSVDSCHRGP